MRKFQNFLINPRVQLKVIAAFALASVVQFIFSSIFISVFFKKFIQIGQQLSLGPDHPFFTLLQKQENYLWLLMGIAALFGILSTVLIGFYISHKMVGPMVRLKGHLQKLAENPDMKLEHITFRQGDDFQEVKDAFNSFVNSRSK